MQNETKLRRLLEDEGRSQAWLARQVGCHRAQMWGYVAGLHVPEQPMRRKIAEALQRQISECFDPADLEPTEMEAAA